MPRNGSGVYTLPAGNPVVPGTTIDAAWANSTLEDMANEITNSLSRTGAGGMIAPFRIADGNITAPGLAFLNETGSGLYRSGAASIWMAIQGVNTAQFTTTGVNIPAGKTLAAGGNATVGGNLAVTGTIASTGGVFNTTIDSITNKVGADHIHFKVKATQTLVKGDVVKVTGYNVGDAAFEVAKVSSATDVAVGIVYNNIANGALGAIVNTGLLENIDTSAFTAGQILYPTTSGGLTATKPSSGQYQAIAFVLRSNANNGAILIEASEPLFVQASTNTGNTLVLRDGSGNFSAGTITASLTGNVTGNVSGNAGTVTNGVYTTGSYSDPSWLVSLAGSKVSGNISGNAANVTGTVAIANGGTGSTTTGGARTALDVPTRTGGDASGTWGISITGNAANVTGTVAIANGGTGATTASSARTNLGLAIGTDVPSPTGTGASGTWGISITGNAATVTNGVVTTGSYSDPSWITALAGSKITGNISGNAANVTGTVAVANGGTGATSASGARVNLLPSYTSNELKALRVNAAGTDVEWFTVSAGGDVAGPASATDNALVRFDATTGKLIQNSVGILSDTGDLSGIAALSMSGALTLSGGTANGVAYLNGSKVLTTGSALTFDGTSLGLGRSAAFLSGAGIEVYRNGVATLRLSNITSGQENQVELSSETNGPFRFNSLNSKDFAWAFASSEQMRLTSTGLGIGTSSPSYKLDVSATGTTVASAFRSDQSQMWVMLKDSGTTLGAVRVGSESGSFIAYANGNQLTLNSSGNLGLGVTPSAWATLKPLEIGYIGNAFSGYINDVGIYATSNAYYNGGWKYAASSKLATRYSAEAGVHSWSYAPSGTAGNAISFTQAMTLDASGQLLVGTTSDLGTIGATAVISNASAGYALSLAPTNVADRTGIYMRSTTESRIAWDSSGYLTFVTGTTERARITSSGDFLIGKTTGSDTVIGFGVGSSGSFGSTMAASTNSTVTAAIYSTGASNYRFYVGMGGTVYATSTSISAISDATLKENVRDLETGLTEVMALRPRRFDWKNGDAQDVAGFVAQEVEQVLPELVTDYVYNKDEDGNNIIKKSLKMGDILPTLVKAIQEQQAMIQQLQAEVAALKGN